MIGKQTNKQTNRQEARAGDGEEAEGYGERTIPANQQKALFRGSSHTLYFFGHIPFHDVLLVLISVPLFRNCHTVSLRTRTQQCAPIKTGYIQ